MTVEPPGFSLHRPHIKPIDLGAIPCAGGAAEAGLGATDLGTRIDDEPFACIDPATLRQRFKEDGRVVRLMFERGDQSRAIRVTLRRLIQASHRETGGPPGRSDGVNLIDWRPMKILLPAALSLLAIMLVGCGAVTAVGIKFLYRRADLPAAQVLHDRCYLPAPECDTEKHRLDLYLPDAHGWPVIVFIHGGGWNTGDKNLRAAGADVYANIGRYFAAQGIGVAVINYRLQPTTDWRGQVADARQAVRWVHEHVGEHGGRADAIFLMGHSAGGYLASFVALDTSGTQPTPIRGVICVSGAGLDLTDEQTYALGESRSYYEQRFQGRDTTGAWRRAASPVTYVHPGAPPFLILYAGGEKKKLHRQAHVLEAALGRAGVEHSVVVVPGESHSRMVLTLSRPDKGSVPAVLEFVRKHQ